MRAMLRSAWISLLLFGCVFTAFAEDKDAKTVDVALAPPKPPLGGIVAVPVQTAALPDRPLKLIKVIKPLYPEAARAEALAGLVQVEAIVDEEGNVDSVKPLSGNPILAEAAASAIRRWTYEAAIVNGKPVRSTTVVKLNFKAPE